MISRTESEVSVFLAASLALTTVTLPGAVFGGVLSQFIPIERVRRGGVYRHLRFDVFREN